MPKNKKERKESISEDEDSSSSDSSVDEVEKKNKKHTKKTKQKQSKKRRIKKKNKSSKHSSSNSEDSSSDSSSSSSQSSSSESEAESSRKKRTDSKYKTDKNIESSVREIRKHKSRESSRNRDVVERREVAHSSSGRDHHAKWQGCSEEKQRRPSRDRRERSKDRGSRNSDRLDRSVDGRVSRDRDFGNRERCRDRDQSGWSGGGRGGEHRGHFYHDNRNYSIVNSSRNHRFGDRRDDRDRNSERHFEQRGDQRDDWNRNRYNERRDRSRSPRQDDERGHRDRKNSPARQRPQQRQRQRRHSENDNESYEWGKRSDSEKAKKEPSLDPADKEKPNFGLSGALTEDSNKVNGVVVKYAEPQEARKPKRRWRLYPFKGETALPTLHIHRQSCFLVGRDRKVVDLAVDHPSCSKQHAALQYRLVPFDREDGTTGKRVRLYLIDLESANGTFLNNKQIEARKYYELIEKDVIKFGFSTREYVLLHENSKEDQEDDDVDVKQEPEDAPLEAPNP